MTCPLCGSGVVRWAAVLGSRSWAECRQCGGQFSSPVSEEREMEEAGTSWQ